MKNRQRGAEQAIGLIEDVATKYCQEVESINDGFQQLLAMEHMSFMLFVGKAWVAMGGHITDTTKLIPFMRAVVMPVVEALPAPTRPDVSEAGLERWAAMLRSLYAHDSPGEFFQLALAALGQPPPSDPETAATLAKTMQEMARAFGLRQQ